MLKKGDKMPYEAKNFDNLLGTKGFSNQLLQNHFKLYQGYVANTNKVLESLEKLDKKSPEFAELKRRFGWEFNGMRLHELYFGNLTKTGSKKSGKVIKQLEKEFGSLEKWEEDFKATGTMRGIGWVILYYDTAAKRLFNVWVNEHDVGHPTGEKPLLVMDMWEHAFMIDYGLAKADYIAAFFAAIDWDAVEKRFSS